MHMSELHVKDVTSTSIACFYLVGAMEVFTEQFAETLKLSKASFCNQEWAQHVTLVRRQGYPVRLIVEQDELSHNSKTETLHSQFILKNRTRFYIFDDQAQLLQEALQRNDKGRSAQDMIHTLLVMLQTWRDRIARDIELTVDELAKKTFQTYLPFDWKHHSTFESSYPYPVPDNHERLELTAQEYQEAVESLEASFQSGDRELIQNARSLYLRVFLYLTASPEFWDQQHQSQSIDLLETAVLKTEDFKNRKVLQYFIRALHKFTPQSYPLFAIYPEDITQYQHNDFSGTY